MDIEAVLAGVTAAEPGFSFWRGMAGSLTRRRGGGKGNRGDALGFWYIEAQRH